MVVRIFESARHASRAAARIIADRLARHPASVLGLPTGRTSIPVYEELVRLRPDFSRARTFNLDEFVGLPRAAPGTYRAFMEHHLFRRVEIPDRQVQFLNGAAPDLEAECVRFERALAAAGGLDLLLLGIGANGHIGFNEPGPSLVVGTHVARLTLATRRANAGLFGGRVRAVPRQALSMGVGTILGSRAIVLIATGRSKAPAVRRMLDGRVRTSAPASFLQLHSNVRLVLDRAAARLL
jgi:glucosamine-6-phosphate deaminase